jgi:hypothetical protein
MIGPRSLASNEQQTWLQQDERLHQRRRVPSFTVAGYPWARRWACQVATGKSCLLPNRAFPELARRSAMPTTAVQSTFLTSTGWLLNSVVPGDTALP